MTARRRQILLLICAGIGLCCGLYQACGAYIRRSARADVADAEACLQRNDPIAAAEAVSLLLWFDPTNMDALLIQGLSLYIQQKFEESIAVLEQIPLDSAQFESSGQVLARSLVLDNQFEDAEDVLRHYLARFPHADSARDELVQLYVQQLRKPEAIELLRARLRLLPGDVSGLPGLLRLHVQADSPERAIQHLSAVNQQQPGQASVVLALARSHALTGNLSEAARYFDEAVVLRPGHAATSVQAAEFCVSQGDTVGASKLLLREQLDQFEAVDGGDSEARYWYVKARLHLLLSEKDEALEAITRSLEKFPAEIAYLSFRGDVLRQLGKVSEAAAVSRRAGELSLARRRLFLLEKELDLTKPDRMQCEEIADLMEILMNHDEAHRWRLAAQLDREAASND